jgi:hypothetical protein
LTNSGVISGGNGGAGAPGGAGGRGLANSGTIGTLINTGTIKHGAGGAGGLGGYAIYSTGSIGSVTNSGQIDGAVLIAAGGDTFTNWGSIAGNFTFSGASSTLDNHGQLTGAVSLAAGDQLDNFGLISGPVTLGAGDILANAGGIQGTVTMGAGTTLILGKASVFTGAIVGYTAGDAIDLIDTSATFASVDGADQLVIANGARVVATLQLSGTYFGATFTLASDGHGGSDVTVAAQGASPAVATAPAPPHGLIAAMASLGATAATAVATAHVEPWRPTLLGPRVSSA